ncbi:MAG TPA: GGDEF domain-containing protein [Longimicrobiales bacterium]|nr:GGDEF domain-containing protein [Longimicrobiales bacterium]
MNRIKVDLRRRALAINIAVAALAAAGITSLTGAPAVLAIPVLTALLAYALVVWGREAEVRAGPTGGGAMMDALTGLTTEDIGNEALAREFAAAQRGRPLTVVLLRLEGLPQYRVRHGKGVADQLLRVTGRTLARHCRGMHLTARHGRREGTFLSILSASDRKGAAVYAARLHRDLVQPAGLPEPAGVSIGIASYDRDMASPSELIRKATYAMERGAEAGGKVMVVGDGA